MTSKIDLAPQGGLVSEAGSYCCDSGSNFRSNLVKSAKFASKLEPGSFSKPPWYCFEFLSSIRGIVDHILARKAVDSLSASPWSIAAASCLQSVDLALDRSVAGALGLGTAQSVDLSGVSLVLFFCVLPRARVLRACSLLHRELSGTSCIKSKSNVWCSDGVYVGVCRPMWHL